MCAFYSGADRSGRAEGAAGARPTQSLHPCRIPGCGAEYFTTMKRRTHEQTSHPDWLWQCGYHSCDHKGLRSRQHMLSHIERAHPGRPNPETWLVPPRYSDPSLVSSSSSTSGSSPGPSPMSAFASHSPWMTAPSPNWTAAAAAATATDAHGSSSSSYYSASSPETPLDLPFISHVATPAVSGSPALESPIRPGGYVFRLPPLVDSGVHAFQPHESRRVEAPTPPPPPQTARVQTFASASSTSQIGPDRVHDDRALTSYRHSRAGEKHSAHLNGGGVSRSARQRSGSSGRRDGTLHSGPESLDDTNQNINRSDSNRFHARSHLEPLSSISGPSNNYHADTDASLSPAPTSSAPFPSSTPAAHASTHPSFSTRAGAASTLARNGMDAHASSSISSSTGTRPRRTSTSFGSSAGGILRETGSHDRPPHRPLSFNGHSHPSKPPTASRSGIGNSIQRSMTPMSATSTMGSGGHPMDEDGAASLQWPSSRPRSGSTVDDVRRGRRLTRDHDDDGYHGRRSKYETGQSTPMTMESEAESEATTRRFVSDTERGFSPSPTPGPRSPLHQSFSSPHRRKSNADNGSADGAPVPRSPDDPLMRPVSSTKSRQEIWHYAPAPPPVTRAQLERAYKNYLEEGGGGPTSLGDMMFF